MMDMHPMVVDDARVGHGIMVKHCHTLPQGLPDMGCCYAIVWQKRDGFIVPTVTRGLHKFMDESTTYTFCPNEGYVGRISEALDSIQHEVISNMFCIDPRAFVRKPDALLNGISSVLFIPHPAGVLLEMGFSGAHDAEVSLPLLLTSHTLALEQCVLADVPGGLSITGTDRNGIGALRTRSPSPAYARNDSWWPSIGSQGHPLCCQLPCKYVRKRKGCKDGQNCTRCHLCQFTKSGEKHSFSHEFELKANAVAATFSTLGAALPDFPGATLVPHDKGQGDK